MGGTSRPAETLTEDGRAVRLLRYPGDAWAGTQVIPQRFDAPDATEDQLPPPLRSGQRIDWATAQQFRLRDKGSPSTFKGFAYLVDGREYVVWVHRNFSYPNRTFRSRGDQAYVNIMTVPAAVADVVTSPVQVIVAIVALSQWKGG